MAQWYYASGGTQSGPVEDAALRQLATSGGLAPNDLVWKEGMPEWVPASRIKALFPAGAGGGTDAAVATAAPAYAAQPAGTSYDRAAGSPGTLAYAGGGGGGSTVSPVAVQMLAQTKPWVRLFSILMFVGFGIIALFSLFGLFAGVMVGGRASALGLIPSLVNLAVAALYFFPALFLSRYASRIGSLVASNRAEDLEGALEAQKSFWKFIGILTAIWLGLVLILVLLMVVLGVAGASGAFG
jgi:hypothetical protein